MKESKQIFQFLSQSSDNKGYGTSIIFENSFSYLPIKISLSKYLLKYLRSLP